MTPQDVFATVAFVCAASAGATRTGRLNRVAAVLVALLGAASAWMVFGRVATAAEPFIESSDGVAACIHCIDGYAAACHRAIVAPIGCLLGLLVGEVLGFARDRRSSRRTTANSDAER